MKKTEKKTLTDAYVKRIKTPQTGRKEYFDALVPGFGVRVTDKGSKSYIVFYRVNGKQSRVTLGSIHELSLKEARETARDYRVAAKGGIDLKDGERHAKAEAARKRLGTFESVSQSFIEEYCEVNNKSWRERQRMFRKYVNPVLGESTIESITRWEVKNLVADIAKNNGPVQANRVAGAIRALYSWLRKEEHFEGANPGTGVEAPNFKEKSRERVLAEDEIRSFLVACDKMGWPYGPFFKFLLLTGQRRGETSQLKWSDIPDHSAPTPRERGR